MILSPGKLARGLGIALLLGFLPSLATTVRAENLYGVPTPMSVTLEREQVNFTEPIYCTYLTIESNNFAFRVPPGFRLSGDPASGTLTLVNREGNCSVSLKLASDLPFDDQGLDVDGCRAVLLRKYSDAKVEYEFSRPAAGASAKGFDLSWKVSGQTVLCKRVVFVPTAAGVLEFTASTSRTNIVKLRNQLDSVFGTLRFSARSKVKIPPLADQD